MAKKINKIKKLAKEKKFKKNDNLKFKTHLKKHLKKRVKVLDVDSEGDFNSYKVEFKKTNLVTWAGEDDLEID